MVLSTNLEYRAGERQRKREIRLQATEAQREKRDKKTKETFFYWKKNMKICSGSDKVRNARGHKCKVKMSGSEKIVNENAYDISFIKRLTKKFLEASRCSREKQRQRNVQKKCAARAKLLFLLIRPVIVFLPFSGVAFALSITRFYILFEQTINIIESFAFSPGYIYILVFKLKKKPKLASKHVAVEGLK